MAAANLPFAHARAAVGSRVFEEDVDAAGSEGRELLHVPRDEGLVLGRLPRAGGVAIMEPGRMRAASPAVQWA